MLSEGLTDILALVVDRGVEAEVVHHVAALLGPSGDADRATVLELGDLSHHLSHGSGGAGDHDGLARLGTSDVEQPEIGCHSGHAERAEIYRQRHALGLDLGQAVATRDGVLLNPQDPGDVLVHLEVGVAGFDHPPRRERSHDLADSDRGNVGGGVGHPPPHGGVQRDEQDLDQDLAFARFTHRLLGVVPVLRRRQPDGPRG